MADTDTGLYQIDVVTAAAASLSAEGLVVAANGSLVADLDATELWSGVANGTIDTPWVRALSDTIAETAIKDMGDMWAPELEVASCFAVAAALDTLADLAAAARSGKRLRINAGNVTDVVSRYLSADVIELI